MKKRTIGKRTSKTKPVTMRLSEMVDALNCAGKEVVFVYNTPVFKPLPSILDTIEIGKND